jgi:hypothetical protein
MATALIISAIAAIILFAVVAYGTLLPAPPQHAPRETEPSISLRALRTLINDDEDAFVRSRLSKSEYARLQRKKYRVARAYALELSQYGAGMAALGQAARRSSNPEISAAADRLVDTALRLRSISLIVRFDLGIRLLVPSGSAPLKRLISHYERVQDAAASLNLARSQFTVAQAR